MCLNKRPKVAEIIVKEIEMSTFIKSSLIIAMLIGIVFLSGGTFKSKKAENDNAKKSYDEILKQFVYSYPHFRGSAVLKIEDCLIGGRSIDKFADPNAVPFLIDVAVNGPNWVQQKGIKDYVDIGPHMARCVAMLIVGVHKDLRGLEPLVELLKNGNYLEQKYNLTDLARKDFLTKFTFEPSYIKYGGDPCEVEAWKDFDIRYYAAKALELMGDPCAVDALVEVVKDSNEIFLLREKCLDALSCTRDMRALPVLLEYCYQVEGNKTDLISRLRHLLKAGPKIKSTKDRKSTVAIWRKWLQLTRERAGTRFGEQYAAWRGWRLHNPGEPAKKWKNYWKMKGYGIATLPYMVQAVEAGEAELSEWLWLFTGGEVKKDAGRQDILDWWKKNKQRWLIPYDKILSAN